MHVCVRAYVHVHACVCVCVCVRACVHARKYAYMCVLQLVHIHYTCIIKFKYNLGVSSKGPLHPSHQLSSEFTLSVSQQLHEFSLHTCM